MRDDELEVAIATYRSELEAGVALRSADLDEIEDHLRALIDELRAAGRSAEVAFTEAVCRLGEPRAIAREYARVRPAFGARLSRARAWSATALLAPMVLLGILSDEFDPTSMFGGIVLCSIATVVALACRATWARAIVLGYAAYSVANCAYFTWAGTDVGFDPRPYLVASFGMAAFLAPWRRGELSAAGWALMLIGAAFPLATATWFLPFDPVPATVALITFAVGGAGVMLRARWGSAALLVCAGALVVFDPAMVVVALALIAAAALSWRTARAGAGSVRALSL